MVDVPPLGRYIGWARVDVGRGELGRMGLWGG